MLNVVIFTTCFKSDSTRWPLLKILVYPDAIAEEFRTGEVRVSQHLLEVVDVVAGDIAEHQNCLAAPCGGDA